MKFLPAAGALAVLLVFAASIDLRGSGCTGAALPESESAAAPVSHGLEVVAPVEPDAPSQPAVPKMRVPVAVPALVARVLGEVEGDFPQGAHVVAEDSSGRSMVGIHGSGFEVTTTTTGTLRLWLEGIERCVSEPAQLEIDRLGAEYRVTLYVESFPRLGIRFVGADGKPSRKIGRLAIPTAVEYLVATATATPPTSPVTMQHEPDGFVRSELGRFDPKSRMWSSNGVEELIDGVLELDVQLPVVVSAVLGNEVVDYRTVQDDDQVVEFRLEDSAVEGLTMQITGRLLRADDLSPIADTGALALDRDPTTESQYVLAATDEAGRFSFGGIPRCPWFLVVNVPGLQLMQIPIDGERQRIELGDILVLEAAMISGYAVDEQGAPVRAPRVWVGTVEKNARDRRAMGTRGGGVEREDGWCCMAYLPKEQLVVGMWPEPGRAARPVIIDGSTGGVIDIQLTVVPGVALTIAGDDLQDVEILDERGFLVWSCGEDGPLGNRSLAPGDYRLTDGRRSQVVRLVEEPVVVTW